MPTNPVKIINDPIYGFIMVPKGILTDLMDHPWFQRLRRIKQLGLSHFVYPGAVHTRFQHALGAFHLITKSLEALKLKGYKITPEEMEAAQIAILLHDVGHGPFSHVLEHSLVPVDHENLTLLIMQDLNKEFNGALELAIQIFQKKYPKYFLSQLVSSQLDVDRMDYLNRDSFFTGVAEGTIGYDRILNMMGIDNERLVFEEKAVLSIESYLSARRLMYWQVYMHKTSLMAEHMLQVLLSLCKLEAEMVPLAPKGLHYFLYEKKQKGNLEDPASLLNAFKNIDDNDIEMLLKNCIHSADKLIAYLANCLLSRKFFKIIYNQSNFSNELITQYREQTETSLLISKTHSSKLVYENPLEFQAYNPFEDEIMIQTKSSGIIKLSEAITIDHFTKKELKYFLGIPKEN
ncbi:MAG: HD domain-containing protein [Saprospiraceae bacterium]|nr:HD domain-containing protein [Saprospiraceae bacterium]HRG67541.1 HD domain-containing protein [Saprospiraceae bacterium]